MTNKDNLIKRYSNKGWTSQFIKIRFWDAPFLEVERLIPKVGTIIDLGCGEGIFTNFLALSSNKRKIIGIELNQERINQAEIGLKNVKFLLGDATKIIYPEADVIVIFHMLHHLNSYQDQDKLLKNCLRKLKPRGKLIVVEINKEFSLRYLITWFTDHFLVPWIFERRLYSKIFFRNKADWKKILTNLGFKVKILNTSRNKPFPHVIFVCQK